MLRAGELVAALLGNPELSARTPVCFRQGRCYGLCASSRTRQIGALANGRGYCSTGVRPGTGRDGADA